MKRRGWWSNTRVPRWRRAILFLDANPFAPPKRPFVIRSQVGAIVGESRKALSNRWKRILPVGTNWCFVARTSSWPPGDERVRIYIYTRRISNSKFSILDWSRISTVDHLRLSCALWKWFSKYEVYIYKKRWIRVLDRAILLEEEQSKVIFILCHFLDNLIRSIIKFRVSQLNRRLEIEGTDNACLTTGKLHLLSLARDQFY